MAQGTRGRLTLLGAGLLFCLGCMNDEPKSIGKGPAKPTTNTMGANPNSKTPTTYGGGIQQTGFTNTGRPDPKTDYFKTAGATVPTTPGVKGTGTPMPPPLGLAPTPSSDPYAGSRLTSPTYPPSGLGAQPPFAPDGPAGAFPVPPMAPAGAVAPMSR
ncbi:MAG: hypothetical protein U0791_19280 [Gemmataceae bacterium]